MAITTLKELRKLFKKNTGRDDMIDSMIDIYLNRGQKFLDDLVDHSKSRARAVGQLAVKDFMYKFTTSVKVIEKVSLIDVDNKTVAYPTQLDIDDLRMINPTLLSQNAAGTPTYYAIGGVRRAPENVELTNIMASTGLTGLIDVIETGTTADKNAIVFDCPVDKAYMVIVDGKFYSGDLTDSFVDTFWFFNYPFSIVDAAMFRFETDYRNSEGANDWLRSINLVITELDKNEAATVSANINRMEG